PFSSLRTDIANQDAVGRIRTATNATAKLVELRKSESLRVLDQHHRGIRHIDPYLDNRRSDKHIHRTIAEAAHYRVLLCRRQPPVQQGDPVTLQYTTGEFLKGRGCSLQIRLLRLLDNGIHHVRLPALADLAHQELEDP